MNAAITVPRCGCGNIGSGFQRKDDLGRHNPSCWRISDSAAAQETLAAGFCR
jgi:hypothetical protein